MTPLATLLRPQNIDDLVGQEHLLGPEKPIRRMIETGNLFSFVLFGANGCGKTSIINVISNKFKVHNFNATTFSIKKLREVIEENDQSIIYIDECYRLTATQADVLLPYIENGKVVFLGCTVENPFHTLRRSLLSRCQIFQLEPLSKQDLAKLILKAIKYYQGLGKSIKIDADALKFLIIMASGDARRILTILEMMIMVIGAKHLTIDLIKNMAPVRHMIYDESTKYDMASWMQGAIQASDPDAALYALGKWLESGEDPRYIARRIIVSASEDAAGTPEAAMIAHSAYIAACEIGRPECDIVLAHAVSLIASCPRDKSAAKSIWAIIKDIREDIHIEIPKSLKDCHYLGVEQLGNGAYKDGMRPEEYIGIKKVYYKPPIWSKYKNRNLENNNDQKNDESNEKIV